MTNRKENPCPSPLDIEPTCFSLDPKRALAHAQSIVNKLGSAYGIKPAVGLIIPLVSDPTRILYGLRDPMHSDEFPNAWGLPSTSITIEMFEGLVTRKGGINIPGAEEVIELLSKKKQKLPNSSLSPDQIVGWTGRVRSKRNGYREDYYLLMVDIRTKPISFEESPQPSIAYTEFRWLTPEEHMKIVEENPSKACGACSALAYQAFLEEK